MENIDYYLGYAIVLGIAIGFDLIWFAIAYILLKRSDRQLQNQLQAQEKIMQSQLKEYMESVVGVLHRNEARAEWTMEAVGRMSSHLQSEADVAPHARAITFKCLQEICERLQIYPPEFQEPPRATFRPMRPPPKFKQG